jgi:hypothetical protein
VEILLRFQLQAYANSFNYLLKVISKMDGWVMLKEVTYILHLYLNTVTCMERL